ncbi:MAG TPA: nitrilase-related carbon-nitrogen hydrolase, partial [Gemmatales bacterium]|nr:nitrilase-related carbon-nitrogen hydrolase [Gemmatales bacterium]
MPLHHQGFLRVAAGSPRVSVANPARNLQAILELLTQAEAESVALIVFPELCLTGYTCGDLFQQQPLQTAAYDALRKLIAFTREQFTGIAIVGLPWAVAGSLFNMAAVVHRGNLLALVPKSYLPNYKEFYEHRWFAPASKMTETEITFDGHHIPTGTDLLFSATDVSHFTFGIEICEDLWMPIPPSSLQALQGATVLINLSASTEVIGKVSYRRNLVAQQSGRCQAGYVYAASGVTESTTDVIFSGHNLIAEAGAILAESQRFQRKSQLIV